MKLIPSALIVMLLAGPAWPDEWTCSVPYDEVNGGGTVTIDDNRMVFVSNWPHREPETLKCIRASQTSECVTAGFAPTKSGGAAVSFKLYLIVWEPDDGPRAITLRQPSAIFKPQGQSFDLSDAFPAIGYTFPLTDCKAR